VVFIRKPGIRKGIFLQTRIDRAYDYDLDGSVAE